MFFLTTPSEYVDRRIRDRLRKPTGELTEEDFEEVLKLSLGDPRFPDEQFPHADRCLKELAKLRQLACLFLGGTNITDAGLKELAKLKLPKLWGVWLNETGQGGGRQPPEVTEAGVAELQKALPKCEIYSDFE